MTMARFPDIIMHFEHTRDLVHPIHFGASPDICSQSTDPLYPFAMPSNNQYEQEKSKLMSTTSSTVVVGSSKGVDECRTIMTDRCGKMGLSIVHRCQNPRSTEPAGCGVRDR